MNDINFATHYRKPIRFSSEIGSREKIIYKSRYMKDGTLEIVEAGRENLYDYIQSFANSVDINVILERFANGDVGALSKSQGIFGDFTNLPSSFVGVLNLVNSGREYFESLPLDVRAKFGHSFDRFVASMDDPKMMNDILALNANEVEQQVSSTPDNNGVGDFNSIEKVAESL